MNFSKTIIAAFSFALLIPAYATCCDLCGSYFGVMPMDNQNSFSIVHRFRVYNGYRSMYQNGTLIPSGSYRLSTPPSVMHGAAHEDVMSPTDFESFKVIEIRGRYFIHERVQLDLVLPVVNNKAKVLGSTANVWGAGDVSVCAGYRVLQSNVDKEFRQRLLIGLGVKLPTGSTESTFDDGDRLPLMMQPGTGSYDILGMFTYAASWHNWIFGLTSHNRYNTTNSYHEQVMPVTNNNLSIAKGFFRESWKFYPQLQVYQEFTQGMRQNGYLIAGTRMNNVLAGPGFEMFYKGFGFSCFAQFPVYQEVYEMNMEMTCRLMAGISYNFASGKYIFQ